MSEPPRTHATFLQALRTIFWSFLGIRKGRDHERQTAPLHPGHIIVAGLLGAALFVASLILIVRSILA